MSRSVVIGLVVVALLVMTAAVVQLSGPGPLDPPGNRPAAEPAPGQPPPGSSAEGRHEGSIKVEPGRTPEPARMEQEAVLLGRVLEHGTGKPLAGILALGMDNSELARSDESGRFRIGRVGEVVIFDLVGPFHQRQRFGEKGLAPGETRETTYHLLPGGRVSGRVVDHRGEPVAGAWVDTSWRIVVGAHIGRSYSARPRYLSDDDGRFDLGGAPPGEEVRVFAAVPERCSGASGPLTVRTAESVEEIEVRLLPPCIVALRLTTDDGSDPGRLYCRPNADPDDPWFPVRGAGKTVDSSGLSGTGGRLTLGGLVRGSFAIPLSAEGFIPLTLSSEDVLPPESEKCRDVEVTLERGLTISGWVRDAAGAPIPGARLSATLEQEAEAWDLFRGQAEADDDGRFEITGLKAGTYVIKVADRNRAELFQSAEVPAGTVDLVLTAPKVASGIEGKLLDAAGAPLRFASLLAFRDSGTSPPGAGQDGVRWGSGKDGVYRMDLGPGTWWLLPPGGPAVRAEVSEGRGTGPAVVVAQDCAVRGVVRGPDGPLADAFVLVAPFPLSDETPYHFRSDVGFCRTGWTDEHGAYRVAGLGAGPVTVRAYHADWLPVRAEVDLEGRETEVDLELAEGGWIDLQPVGPDTSAFPVKVYAPLPPYGHQTPQGSPDTEFQCAATRRRHPDRKMGLVEEEAAPGRSFALGPYLPGTYTVTVRATLPIPGTDRTVELSRSAAAKIEGPGRVPLEIVFTREDVASAR